MIKFESKRSCKHTRLHFKIKFTILVRGLILLCHKNEKGEQETKEDFLLQDFVFEHLVGLHFT